MAAPAAAKAEICIFFPVRSGHLKTVVLLLSGIAVNHIRDARYRLCASQILTLYRRPKVTGGFAAAVMGGAAKAEGTRLGRTDLRQQFIEGVIEDRTIVSVEPTEIFQVAWRKPFGRFAPSQVHKISF